MAARASKLDLTVDEGFQTAEWRFQRVGWIVWGVLILAGFAGLLGPGPLSSTEVMAADNSLTVAYDRFLHYHNPTQLVMTVEANGSDSELQIKLSNSLLDRMEISRIEPSPVRSELMNDGVLYTFARGQHGDAGRIIFFVDFERFGRSQGEVGVVGREPVLVKQFVYP
jgi:hypothetical protein